MAKADNIEVERRVRVVAEYLLQGQRAGDICRNLSAKWTLSTRQVERYIEAAYAEMKAENQRQFGKKRQWHVAVRTIAHRDLLAERNKILQDKTPMKPLDRIMALAKIQREIQTNLQDLAKLQGLYVERVEHGGKIETTLPVNLEIVYRQPADE